MGKLGTDLLARHSYLRSLLDDTNRFLGESRLDLIHTDYSFSVFDGRLPNPWLLDVGQAEWLLHNHEQITAQGKTFMRRLFALPLNRRLSLEERLLFRATVKAVLHLQMYEGVRAGVWPVSPSERSRRLSFSLARTSQHRIAWPAWRYYDGTQQSEARRGDAADLNEVETKLDRALSETLWLTPYRDEHFERGCRLTLPKSWRRFLFILYEARCSACNGLVRDQGELDHMRPLKPEESCFHAPSPGNSTIFNLCLLCRRCNREKYTHFVATPERYIPQLIWDRRLELYFRVSLTKPPSAVEHALPDYPLPLGDELVIKS